MGKVLVSESFEDVKQLQAYVSPASLWSSPESPHEFYRMDLREDLSLSHDQKCGFRLVSDFDSEYVNQASTRVWYHTSKHKDEETLSTIAFKRNLIDQKGLKQPHY